MSAPQPIGAFAPQLARDRARILTERFEAWHQGGFPLDVSAATTLGEARDEAARHCRHKDHFTVLQHTIDGKHILHVYYVKQTKPVWMKKPDMAHAVQVRPLAVEHRFSQEVAAYEPVAPWRWSPGADVVGLDRNVVEN